jgi:hypothetical protein
MPGKQSAEPFCKADAGHTPHLTACYDVIASIRTARHHWSLLGPADWGQPACSGCITAANVLCSIMLGVAG